MKQLRRKRRPPSPPTPRAEKALLDNILRLPVDIPGNRDRRMRKHRRVEEFPDKTKIRPLRILVTGSNGLIGSALFESSHRRTHKFLRLVRRAVAAPPDISWDPEIGTIDRASIENADAVIHLAGENIANGRWTRRRMERIKSSRVNGTRVLCEALAGLKRPPRVLVSASAIGFYGNRGEEWLTEGSARGTTFLSDVCSEWERATSPAEAAGIRTVRLRMGIVLSPEGGALARMLGPFRKGLGGRLGNGGQYYSWISIEDLVGVMLHLIANDSLHGPLNAVSPNPVTNLEFTKTLGRVLRRWTMFPIPGFAARLIFGRMADELLLASARVSSRKLELSGYRFIHPELESALCHLLRREPPQASWNRPQLGTWDGWE